MEYINRNNTIVEKSVNPLDNLNLGLLINFIVFLKIVDVNGISTNNPSSNNIGPMGEVIKMFIGPVMDVEIFWNKNNK